MSYYNSVQWLQKSQLENNLLVSWLNIQEDESNNCY
jgi:hypothetical protein